MNRGAHVEDVERYRIAGMEIGKMVMDTREAVQKDIRNAKDLLEETQREEVESTGLLQIAIQEENSARDWLNICIVEEETAAALEPYDAAWHAAAIAKKMDAQVRYEKAVDHRFQMESRLDMAKNCVFQAEEMVETLQKQLQAAMREARQTAEFGMERMGKAYGILNEVLSVDFEGAGEGQDSDRSADGEKETVSMNPGKDSRVVFIFSCPGQEEAKAGRVCAGQTGRNLDILIGYLHEMRPDIFRYTERYDYRITNASTVVEYQGKTGKTEAKAAVIKTVENRARLQEETREAEYILCMGRNARIAMEGIMVKGKKIESRHLGFSSINYIRVEAKGDDATKLRIKTIAEEIVDRL